MADENTESEKVKKDYLNDQWTTEVKALGRTNFVNTIHTLIQKVDPPFALSINGRWGAGKTSVLRALMENLDGTHVVCTDTLSGETKTDSDSIISKLKFNRTSKKESNSLEELDEIITIWFNPWQYQQEDNPLIPLLHEIHEQIHAYFKFSENCSDSIKNSAEASLYSIAGLMDAAVNFVAGTKGAKIFADIPKHLQESSARRSKEEFRDQTDGQRFFLQFEKAIKQAVGDKGRLVIFIDDLDRCHDEAIFKLLESIKLYLSSRNCVFVFGLDAGHVETAISRVTEYSYQESARYVDKLFQVRLDLPEPSEDKIGEFIGEKWEEIFSKQIDLKSFDTKDLATYLPKNPRFIKNFLNNFKFYVELWKALKKKPEGDKSDAEVKNTEPDPVISLTKNEIDNLLLVQLFRAFYPDAYEVIKQDISYMPQISELVDVGTPKDELQVYLHRILENPMYRGKSIKDGSEKMESIDDKRFQQIKTIIPHAKATQQFLEKFCLTFEATPIDTYFL